MQKKYFLEKTWPVSQQAGKFLKFVTLTGPECTWTFLHFNSEVHAECEQNIFLNGKRSQKPFSADLTQPAFKIFVHGQSSLKIFIAFFGKCRVCAKNISRRERVR
jgi:hypothetical protein